MVGLIQPAATSTLTIAMYRTRRQEATSHPRGHMAHPALEQVERKKLASTRREEHNRAPTRPPRFKKANPAQATADANASIQRCIAALPNRYGQAQQFASAG